ncbi:chromate efflux transporter [Methylacidiphilales bacterium]|nr:chromate efflux transporter [Candidatus Methylacidiphilales bacterium]
MTTPAPSDPDSKPRPTFAEAFRFWSRLGWINFGGPTGQIAIMHRELVDRKKWIDEKHFLHALNYCMMLPGPEAQQLATYLGWYLHGIRGGVCAGALFVFPAVFILWGLSLIYVCYGTVPIIAAAFYGLVPAVIAIVFHAMVRLAGKTLHDPLRWLIAISAAVLIYFYRDAYPCVVLGAGLLGWIFRKKNENVSPVTEPKAGSSPIRIAPLVRVAIICIAIWFAPLLILGSWLGWNHIVAQEGIFFSKAALVTFGGAYAVLPYVAQHAVEQYHWLSRDEMLHGFGLAETTPGPLIMVLQFVGFLGAWHHPGGLHPLTAATLGSFITSWVTFAPSFLFILVGAPFVERLGQIAAIQSALSAISAAVVGVMANFAIWFAWHALFPGNAIGHPDLFVLAVSVGSFVALWLWQADVMLLIGLCAALGVIYRVII